MTVCLPFLCGYLIYYSPPVFVPPNNQNISSFSLQKSSMFGCSASGCPHANKNRTRSLESSLAMGGSLLKYGGLIKPTIHSVPYQPPPPGQIVKYSTKEESSNASFVFFYMKLFLVPNRETNIDKIIDIVTQ